MMLPILIWVSVTPGPYFPLARDGLAVAANIARAAEATPNRQSRFGILNSLIWFDLCGVFLVGSLSCSGRHSTPFKQAQQEKPLRIGRHLVEPLRSAAMAAWLIRHLVNWSGRHPGWRRTAPIPAP